MKYILPIFALAMVGCSTVAPIPPRPEAKKVVVTDAAPSNAVVERSVARVEARVVETSSKVDEVGESVSAAIEKAIRANDEERLTEARALEAQVDDLRISVKVMEVETTALNEEVTATREVNEAMQAERDAARMAEAKAISIHEAAELQYVANIAAEQGRTLSQKDRADRMTKTALMTGGALTVVTFSALGYIAWRIFK